MRPRTTFFGKSARVMVAMIMVVVTHIMPYVSLAQASPPPANEETGQYLYKVVFTKHRCPNCGMDFYVRNVKSPYALEEAYDASKKLQDDKPFEMRDGYPDTPRQSDTHKPLIEGVFEDLFTSQQPVTDVMPAEGFPTQADLAMKQKAFSLEYDAYQRAVLAERLQAEYITCPYDGFRFHPKYSPQEIKKMIGRETDQASSIENVFSQSQSRAIDRTLRQFGYDLFSAPQKAKEAKTQHQQGLLGLFNLGKSAGLQQAADSFDLSRPKSLAVVPIHDDYILGPGDTLVITVWGATQDMFPVTIDREGKIVLPKAGPVHVRGMEFARAEELIKKKLLRHYTNFQIDVSMGELRSLQVFVLGEVKKPGSYDLNAQSTVFDALYAAGGVLKLGSLRTVKVIRQGKLAGSVDLYDLLLNGNSLADVRIESGDTVFVPPIGDVVGIAGNVKRPAIYETTGKFHLRDLLAIAGGITPLGTLQRIQLERIVDGERKVVFDVGIEDIDDASAFTEDISLQNGDLVVIVPIQPLRRNFVTIMGNVNKPGDYELQPRMTVQDLLAKAAGLLPGTHLRRAEVARVTKGRTRQIISVDLEKVLTGIGSENLMLNEWDIVLVYAEADVAPPVMVEIYGEVAAEGAYELSPGMKVSDLIFRAGGLTATAAKNNIELFKLADGQPKIITLDLTTGKDPVLHEGDQLFIRKQAQWQKRKLITLKGQVKYPGQYAVRSGERLSSIIERAGGFTDEASIEGAIFTRESIREAQKRAVKKFVEMQKRMLVQTRSALSGRGMTTDDVKRQDMVFQDWKATINEIAYEEVSGRMVVRLAQLDELKKSKYDILIEDGDTLEIPQIPSTVDVMGSVNNPTSVLHEPNKGIDYYVDKVGGVSAYADMKRIFVIRANGEAISRYARIKTIERGDTIVVPAEMNLNPSSFRSYLEVMSKLVLSAAVVVNLID